MPHQYSLEIEVLGTPTEENWPGVSQLPDYHKISFTETRQLSFEDVMLGVDETSIVFLERFLRYNPSTRITTNEVILNYLTLRNESKLTTILIDSRRRLLLAPSSNDSAE